MSDIWPVVDVAAIGAAFVAVVGSSVTVVAAAVIARAINHV
jgi:hypothetical protein